MILSDFPMFVGEKWLKYNCNVVTKTTYTKWATPSNIPLVRTENNKHQITCYSGYTFSEATGFSGQNSFKCYGNQASGYYVDDTGVYQYANGVSVSDSFGEYTKYTCPQIAGASKKTTTTYSKGDTAYAPIYVDENELPEEGQLIEGSANGAYCVIKVDGTVYYYEKSN